MLGCAGIARRRLLPAFAAAAQVRLSALASRDGDKAARWAGEHPGCTPVTGYQELLEREDVDAVYIPLPAGLHAEWTERALRAGKHVLVEKPMAIGQARAAALVELARSRKLVLRENLMFLRHSAHSRVAQLCRQGEIGQIRSFHGCFGFPPLDAADIRYRGDLGGGALLDAGVYPLRAARHLLGEDLGVLGAVLRCEGDVDVGGEVLLTTVSGIGVDISFGFGHDYRSDYEMWGSAGRLRLERAYTPPATSNLHLHVHRPDGDEIRYLPADDQVTNAVTDFTAAIQAGRAQEHDETVHQAALLECIRATARYVRNQS